MMSMHLVLSLSVSSRLHPKGALSSRRLSNTSCASFGRRQVPPLRMPCYIRAAASPEVSTVSIITQGRHVEVTPALRQYVEDKVSRAIHNYANDIKEVDVTLSVAGGDRGHGAKQQKTDITIYTLRNGVVRVEDVEESMYASIDLVADKISRKMRKVKEKAIAKGKWPGGSGPKGGQPLAEGLSDDPDELPGELPVGKPAKLPPDVVREKVFQLKPMSVETAIEQVEQVGHDFFVYLDKGSNSVRVLYKRKTRGYGVIVPTLE
eukprot:jgi/Botrbrau1/7282/Bobra.0318s0019.1